MNIKISVIIPMYNSEDTIISVLDSVLNQTYQGEIEIIVVNDGSTDNSKQIVDEYIKKHTSSIKLINKNNSGVSSARNRGIKESSNEWIALLDSDDIWFPKKLQMQVEEVKKNNKIKFIGTNRNEEVYPFFKKSSQHLYTLNEKEIIAKWHPHTSTVLINKVLLLKTGLYDELRTHAEDGDLLLKFSQYADIYVLNKDFVYTGSGKRTFGESGLSANMPKMYQGEILAIKGAKQRKQINFLEYIGFYLYLTLKYLRRIIIVNTTK